jgi:hypothetical protein
LIFLKFEKPPPGCEFEVSEPWVKNPGKNRSKSTHAKNPVVPKRPAGALFGLL